MANKKGPFRGEVRVRFGDVDRAGIVYYPRVFYYLHEAFEELFERRAGISYPDLIGKKRLGFPTVHLDTDFKRPLQYGDRLSVEVTVPRIGNSSAVFEYQIRRGRDLCVRAQVTTVCVDMDTFRPKKIPFSLRTVFSGLKPR